MLPFLWLLAALARNMEPTPRLLKLATIPKFDETFSGGFYFLDSEVFSIRELIPMAKSWIIMILLVMLVIMT